MSKKLSFMLCTTTLDSVKSRTCECIEVARWTLMRDQIMFYWTTTYGDGKARSRNVCASKFLQNTEDIDYLIFVDSDILFTPDHLKKLYDDLVAGYDLVGGLFAVRGGTALSSCDTAGTVYLDGTIKVFEYIATGFMGISRKLLEKMRDEIPLPLLHPKNLKFWPFFEEKQYPDRDGEGIFLSEDYDFCEKARKVGVKSHIDTSIQLGHLGERVYTLEDVLQNQAKEKGRLVEVGGGSAPA